MLLIAIFALGVLIFFHELGHFLFAKAFHIHVEEFGIGYPPRIFGLIRNRAKKWRFFWLKRKPEGLGQKTIYSLNWIPFGGFNQIKGEIGERGEKDSLSAQVWWKKLLVSIGGVLMNFFLAFILFTICFSIGIPRDLDYQSVKHGRLIKEIGIQVSWIEPDSPAEKADLKPGDVILSIDQNKFEEIIPIQEYIHQRPNQPLVVEFQRGDEKLSLNVTALPIEEVFPDIEQTEETKNQGMIGVVFSRSGLVAYNFPWTIWMGLETTGLMIKNLAQGLILVFKTLLFEGRMMGGVAGPVKITAMTKAAAQIGFVYLLQFTALISLAIGIFQLIPFPALDGSRILLAIFEGIFRRPLNLKIEKVIFNLGFYLLLSLLLLITFKEVFGLIKNLF